MQVFCFSLYIHTVRFSMPRLADICISLPVLRPDPGLFLQRKTDSGQIFIYHRAYLRNVYIHIQNHPVARNHNLYLAGFRQSLHKKIDQHFHMSYFSILYIPLDEASRANFRPAGIILRLP